MSSDPPIDNGPSSVEALQADVIELHKLLAIAVREWECGHWNSLLEKQQVYLSREWYEQARAAVYKDELD